MQHYIKKRRNTALIRIEDQWHRQIKMKAAREGKTMAKTLDLICKNYFESPSDGPPLDENLYDYLPTSLHT